MLHTCQSNRSTITLSACSCTGWSCSNCLGDDISENVATNVSFSSKSEFSSKKREDIFAIAAHNTNTMRVEKNQCLLVRTQ